MRAWLQRERNRRVLLGLGLAAFAAGAAGIVSLARLSYFQRHPEQLFADRYLPWSCLFWLGLLLASYPIQKSSRMRAVLTVSAVLMTAVLFLPSHRFMVGISAIYANNMQAAVAAQMGVWDPERSSPKTAASDQDAHATLALLASKKLSMKSELAAELWAKRTHPDAVLDANAPSASWAPRTRRTFHDVQHDQAVVLFEGMLPKETKHFDDATLVVVNENHQIVGLAKRSHFGYGQQNFRFDMPQKRGVHGYVLNPQWGESLRLLLVQPNREVVYSLGFVLQKPE